MYIFIKYFNNGILPHCLKILIEVRKKNILLWHAFDFFILIFKVLPNTFIIFNNYLRKNTSFILQKLTQHIFLEYFKRIYNFIQYYNFCYNIH